MLSMKNFVLRLFVVLSIIVSLSAQSWATCGGGGGGGVGGIWGNQVYAVPWQRMNQFPTIKDGLVVCWFPSSEDEFTKSSLRYSRPLTLFAARCVNLCVADAQSEIGKKLLSGETLPVTFLCDPDGTVLGKAEAVNGALIAPQVQSLVQAEMRKRQDVLLAKLDGAKNKANSGDTNGAIEDCQAIVSQKCLFPGIAQQAAKQLQVLGTPPAAKIDPEANSSPAITNRITQTMKEGIKAELDSKYSESKALYEKAHNIDPEDPTPLRYLGELYRHDIGDWQKARLIFESILLMHADPLSRAVALHGIGKMTIHEGEFKKGEKLMEESVSVYPLAITYRNLAVYWNSEGDFSKAHQYTQEALKLDPKDPFNVVFAAVLESDSGHMDEALKIAKQNEDLLPASYNLAGIYAQAGQKEKALQLLRRHFYEYERNRSVRSKEMMEARVDKVFASLRKDKDFLALTSGADGRLPMPAAAK
jgi:tetratricopeptide (TPR) repeat protein